MTRSETTPTICFDATGTLIETTQSVGETYRRFALEAGVDLPAWRLDDAFRRILRHAPARGLDGASFEERCAHEVDWWFERIRQTFQATDSTVRFDDFRAFAQALFDFYAGADAWRPRPGIPELLARLRDRGSRLFVVSNFDHRLPQILEAIDLKQFFDDILIPSRAARAKPDRALFEAVGTAVGLPLEALLYVGDDAPEILAEIAAHGLRVLDVREAGGPASLADLLLGASGAAPAATLQATTPRA